MKDHRSRGSSRCNIKGYHNSPCLINWLLISAVQLPSFTCFQREIVSGLHSSLIIPFISAFSFSHDHHVKYSPKPITPSPPPQYPSAHYPKHTDIHLTIYARIPKYPPNEKGKKIQVQAPLLAKYYLYPTPFIPFTEILLNLPIPNPYLQDKKNK